LLARCINGFPSLTRQQVHLHESTGGYTLFAPSNDAFNSFLGSLGDRKTALLNDKAKVASLLEYHVIRGTTALSSSLSNGESVKTALASAPPLIIMLQNGRVMVRWSCRYAISDD